MPDTDTCRWPGCREPVAYTCSAVTPPVSLCEPHIAMLLIYPELARRKLNLKLEKQSELPPDVGFAEAAAVVKNHRPE